jgi:hypothetical protein
MVRIGAEAVSLDKEKGAALEGGRTRMRVESPVTPDSIICNPAWSASARTRNRSGYRPGSRKASMSFARLCLSAHRLKACATEGFGRFPWARGPSY